MAYRIMDSPLGPIRIEASAQGITQVHFVDKPGTGAPDPTREGHTHLAIACEQLNAYFSGKRTEFTVPLDSVGTAFQREVWQALGTIPYGETRSYKDIAQAIGNPNAVRAIGGANNKNPITLIIPCHRVINADSSLGGYGCGVERKRWLLAHERKIKVMREQ